MTSLAFIRSTLKLRAIKSRLFLFYEKFLLEKPYFLVSFQKLDAFIHYAVARGEHSRCHQ